MKFVTALISLSCNNIKYKRKEIQKVFVQLNCGIENKWNGEKKMSTLSVK